MDVTIETVMTGARVLLENKQRAIPSSRSSSQKAWVYLEPSRPCWAILLTVPAKPIFMFSCLGFAFSFFVYVTWSIIIFYQSIMRGHHKYRHWTKYSYVFWAGPYSHRLVNVWWWWWSSSSSSSSSAGYLLNFFQHGFAVFNFALGWSKGTAAWK